MLYNLLINLYEILKNETSNHAIDINRLFSFAHFENSYAFITIYFSIQCLYSLHIFLN